MIMFTDINECVGKAHNCSQNCSNTDGSFQCVCVTGYRLNEDGQTCDGKVLHFKWSKLLKTFILEVPATSFIYKQTNYLIVHFKIVASGLLL